jgi:hypothetical protein
VIDCSSFSNSSVSDRFRVAEVLARAIMPEHSFYLNLVECWTFTVAGRNRKMRLRRYVSAGRDRVYLMSASHGTCICQTSSFYLFIYICRTSGPSGHDLCLYACILPCLTIGHDG